MAKQSVVKETDPKPTAEFRLSDQPFLPVLLAVVCGEEAQFKCFTHRGGGVLNIELFVDMADVGVDRGKSDVESVGNLLFHQTVTEQGEDFEFTRRQDRVDFLWGQFLLQSFENETGDADVERCAASHDSADAFGEFFEGGRFEQVARGPSGDRS